MKLEISPHIFEKYLNPSSGSQGSVRTDGRQARHDETNIRFSQFFERP